MVVFQLFDLDLVLLWKSGADCQHTVKWSVLHGNYSWPSSIMALATIKAVLTEVFELH